jgi:HrpA-like RNA helicase
MVLGRAIQPPALKNIDASIKSLMFNGGLELMNDEFHLTDLGRLYIDLPVDIIYSRMLILSMILGTFDDIIILVTLLQQAKNPFRKQGLERKYMEYWELIENEQLCDFYGLVQIYKTKFVEKKRIPEGIEAYNFQ